MKGTPRAMGTRSSRREPFRLEEEKRLSRKHEREEQERGEPEPQLLVQVLISSPHLPVHGGPNSATEIETVSLSRAASRAISQVAPSPRTWMPRRPARHT